MAANEALNALSTTDASNTPAGGDTIGATLDDELRSIKANIARAGRWEVTATVTAAATLTETVLHKVVPVDGSAGGTTTITLPTAGSAGTGFATMLLKVGAANNAIVDGSGAETIDGAANYTLTEQYESVVLVCDGAAWFAASRSNRKTMPALSVDGASTLSGAVTMKTSLTNTGPTTLDGSLTMSATALFALPVTLAGAVTVTGDADFQGALNCGTLTASATAVFKSVASFQGPGRTAITTLTDAATIAIDFASSNDFTVTITANRAMGQPSNQVAGQSGVIYVVQGGVGSHTLTWHADFKWAGGTAPTLSTGAGAVDAIAYHVRAANSIVATAAVLDAQ